MTDSRRNCAPVALFVYNRPWHTRKTVETLLANSGADRTPLYVFSDGPKNTASKDTVAEVRSYIRTISGFRRITLIERESNFGLAQSVICGVNQLCNEYGRVIVLEDDLVTSPIFLSYMNAALDFYEKDQRVMQLSGHIFQVPEFEQRKEALFLPFVTSWGWATWKRAWEHFDPCAQGFCEITTNNLLRNRFNLFGHFDYSTLLEQQMNGKIDSWAIRWYLSVFMKNGITLFPPQSLVKNIGLDSGTHGSRILRWTLAGQIATLQAVSLPQKICVVEQDFIFVQKAIYRQMGGNFGALLRRARRLWANLCVRL